MKKIYQIADNHKKLEAQKTNDVLDSQIELIEDLENDILHLKEIECKLQKV